MALTQKERLANSRSTSVHEEDQASLIAHFNLYKKGMAEADKESAERRSNYLKIEAEERAKLEKDLNDKNKEYVEELFRTAARMKAEGVFNSIEEEQKWVDEKAKIEQSSRDLKIEQEKENAKYISTEKYKTELEILKLQSKERQAQKEFENYAAEQAVKIQEAKNEGNEEEAKKLQRDLNVKTRQKEFTEQREAAGGGPLQAMLGQMKEDAQFAKTAEGKQAARDNMQAKLMKQAGAALNAMKNAINGAINAYADRQTSINARLQGLSSYGEAAKKLGDVAYSPLLKAEDLYNNLGDLVHSGISHNVEQRAFFATVKDGIAETFDVNSAYLNRMIRIQQNDSTAARLGMEGYLTRWLNEYVENTEYLTTTFDNVADSLFEASAVIGAGKNTGSSLEFEAVVQSWLGAMTGVGFSDDSAKAIADALGQLGSGNLDVLESDIGTLFTMAAASEGKNIGEMLVDGLNADITNELLKSAVTFLKSINDNNNNNVTKAEMAKIFGVSMSDLVSLSNLNAEALDTVSKSARLGYNEMYGELVNQFNELPERLGISNILQNLFNNLTYQTGMSIASNPVTYALWKVTDLVHTATGGIPIPFLTALGSGFDLENSIENLMQLGIMGTSFIGNIGKIVNGLSSIGKGSRLLNAMGVDADNANYELKKLGEGLVSSGTRSSGSQLSEMANIVGNVSGEDYATSAQNQAENDANKKLKKKKEEAEETDPTLNYLKKTVQLHSMLKGIYAALGGKFTTNGDIDTSTDEGLANAVAISNQMSQMSGEQLAGIVASATAVGSVATTNALTEIQGLVTDIRDMLGKSFNAGGTAGASFSLNASGVSLTAPNVNIVMSAAANSITTSTSLNGEPTVLNDTLIPANSVSSTYANTNGNTSTYLQEINFDDNFKRLVLDVEAIKNNITSGDIFGNNSAQTENTGFNQPSYTSTGGL